MRDSVRFFVSLLLLCTLTLPSWAYQDEKEPTNISLESPKSGKRSLELCQDGQASGYPCQNVHLLSYLSLSQIGAPNGVGLNDAWGWTDPDTGRLYALVGREDGLAFVDVTDPELPVYVGELLRTQGTQPTTWRDVKVDGTFAFVVADGSGLSPSAHGMQVFDLRKLRSFVGTPITFASDALYSNFAVAHNIAINEQTHRAYIVGAHGVGTSCGGGLHIVDIADPLQPAFMGCFADPNTGRAGTGYTHDTQCVTYNGSDARYTGREICVSSNETAISIADVTHPDLPINLAKGTYPFSAYVHQGWLTEDHRYFVQDDELDERAFGNSTRTMIWDLEDLKDPVLLTIFSSSVPSIDHNLYIRDGLAYQANYSSGLRILDVRDPASPEILGFFDTTPGNDGVSFAGTWTAFPFPNHEMIIVTSREEGLFILEPSEIVGTRFETPVLSVKNGSVAFSWTMTSEYYVSDYLIQQIEEDGSLTAVAEVPSVGGVGKNRSYTSSLPIDEGVYRFRISARSTDGGFMSAPDQTIVSLNGLYLLDSPYPNPSSSQARTRLVVADNQRVRVDVYDLSGRKVLALFDDYLNKGTPLDLMVDTASLSGGIYLLGVQGANFATTKEMVVIR